MQSKSLLAAFLALLVLPVAMCRADVAGVVTNAVTHQPVAGAQITMSNFGFCPVVLIASTVSAADGSYLLQFSPNDYGSIRVDATGYAEFDFSFPSPPSADEHLDMALTPVAAIAGTVYDPASQPVSGAPVQVLDATSGALAYQGQTYADGRFAFNDIAAGSYLVCVLTPQDAYRDSCFDHMDVGPDGIVKGTTITLANGQLVPGADIHLQNGASISGTLIDRATQAPTYIGYLALSLYSPQGSLVADLPSSYTDDNGGYRIAGLAPGSYYLVAGSPFYFGQGYIPHVYGGGDCEISDLFAPPTCSFSGVTPIDVPSTGVTGVDLALSSGAVVTGRVTDAATGSGISDALVFGCIAPGHGETGQTTTDATGNFRLTHVLNTFMVRTYSRDGHMNEVWPHTLAGLEFNCESSDPRSLIVAPSPASVVSGVDFALTVGTHVSGSVVDSRGRAGHVAFYGWDGSGWAFVSSAAIQSDGSYSKDDLEPGGYTAAAYLDDGSACVVYGGYPCGAGWHADDPASVDFTGGAADALIPLGEVLLRFDFQLEFDRVFSNTFE